MKKIIFVRHGESTENLANKKGEKYDESKIVLTKDGIKQAKLTGKYLHKTFGKFDKIYCSPVHRCRQTYDIISEEIKSYNKDLIIDFLKAVDKSAHDRLLSGGQFKGYKLVESSSNRKFTNNAEEVLVKELGEEAYNKKSPIFYLICQSTKLCFVDFHVTTSLNTFNICVK
jgi:bisphosphoglycerate-dependent phosphoglycerate mutase